MPPSSIRMLTPVHITLSPVGRFPTSGSCGQLCVYVIVSPGRYCRRRPRRPPEERRQLPRPLRVRHCTPGNRVGRLPLRKQLRVIGCVGLEGPPAHPVNHNRVRRGIVRVRPEHLLQPCPQCALLLLIQLPESPAVSGPGPFLQDKLQFAPQPVRRPVLRHVAAVAPHRADFHPAHALPDVLPCRDLSRPDHRRPVPCDHAVRDGRLLLVDPRPDPAENRERNRGHGAKGEPEPFHPWNSFARRAAGCPQSRLPRLWVP